jgi:hypothetical protein
LIASARPVRSVAMRSIGPRNQFQPKMAMKVAASTMGASSTPAIHLNERSNVMAVWRMKRNSCRQWAAGTSAEYPWRTASFLYCNVNMPDHA